MGSSRPTSSSYTQTQRDYSNPITILDFSDKRHIILVISILPRLSGDRLGILKLNVFLKVVVLSFKCCPSPIKPRRTLKCRHMCFYDCIESGVS